MKNVKSGHIRPVVCLDAGHYGKYNRSPVVAEYYESDMNWKLHLLLKKELESYGIEIRLTRQDKETDLNEYYRGTASEGADLLLSVHSNAAQRESADYPVVYVPLNGSGNELGKKLAACIRRLMDTAEPDRIAIREGANGDYYGVIRGATAVGTIGLILEHSFHTNEWATKWLMDENNLASLAKEEAKIVAQWFDVAPKTEPEKWYRIRLSWEDQKSQTAAYKSLEGAIKACPVGYTVFDWEGNEVYTNRPKTEETEHLYTLSLPLLQSGDRSDAVKAAQILLEGWGYPCGSFGADGIFGDATKEAVLAYQNAKGLAADGVIGGLTMKHLLGR